MWSLARRLPLSTRLTIMKRLQNAVLWVGDRLLPEVPTRSLKGDL